MHPLHALPVVVQEAYNSVSDCILARLGLCGTCAGRSHIVTTTNAGGQELFDPDITQHGLCRGGVTV